MDTLESSRNNKSKWRLNLQILYILLLATHCQGSSSHTDKTKTEVKLDNKLDSIHCHSCYSSRNNESSVENYFKDIVDTLSTYADENFNLNSTVTYLERAVENILDNALSKNRFKISDEVEIKVDQINDTKLEKRHEQGRELFSKFTYEYRLYQKVKDFINTHILSINLPMAAKSFGINKFFLPILIGGQVLIKSILFAMFLPSILGSFGKMLSKGLSHISASSSQASYPPATVDDQTGYNTDNKDFMGYETNQAGSYAYPQDGMYGDANDVNELGNVDMSRFGEGQKVGFLPSKNSYYKNQMGAYNYKVFQKIPASSMILSNYDPFYSPLLSRLDGIFARLGLEPSDNSINDNIEACREQLICLMYANPAKFAPYSNLISAQLSRELNELRRPVSDNPEILRFFKYMKAARRGQEQSDCMYSYPTCTSNAPKTHTMIAAYHDINKLVTARKLN
ncbi:unnamed protein product [Arctia plantaginis]|uniref:Uncharacterized protein n=1 Tax=Arctia plantaginis TaxID=874455 RepID=A0A8S1BH59_ARCPL|nr:unnamed protein product [Arctia plantaginis]